MLTQGKVLIYLFVYGFRKTNPLILYLTYKKIRLRFASVSPSGPYTWYKKSLIN